MATEDKIKITNEDLAQFRRAAQMYINAFPDRTPLHYGLEKMLKSTKAEFDQFFDEESDIRVDCALIDKETKKFVMADNKKDHAIDPAKAKELQARVRKLSNKEIEITPHWVTDFDPNMEAKWMQQFLGFIIKEEDDPLKKKVPTKEVKND